MDDYCAARSRLIPPLPWPTLSPPFSRHTYRHRQRAQTKPDRRPAALELRRQGVTGAPLTVNRQHARLSVPDTFAFAIAESREWGLLTGDNALRELATAEQIDMHGVLWLFDQFADGNHVSFDRLHLGLSNLSIHPRCRLPANEVRRRLARFAP